MRPLPLAGRVLVATALLAGLAGCELMKRNEGALAVINNRVIGMPAGEFFDRYGRAELRTELADNSTDYVWRSAVPFAPPGMEGQDERICKMHVLADKRGRIASVQIVVDGAGYKSTSRCSEIFAAQ